MERAKMEGLTAMISEDFCFSKHVKLTVVKKRMSVKDCNFEVTDECGKIVFKVKEKVFSLHHRHLLLDATGTPFLTFMKRHLSMRKRWVVYKGESSDSRDLLFVARKSTLVQSKTELDVFLRGNEGEKEWDFKVVGSWLERSCIIYARDWNQIATMHKKHTIGSVVLGRDTFGVTVYPNVDSAFVVALLMIMYEISKERDD